MRISQIVAVANDNVIGQNNRLPWRMPADVAYFKAITWGHHIIMGRKNYQSEGKALPGRTNIVLSRNAFYTVPDGIVVHNLSKGIELARKNSETELFIIGGSKIYELAMSVTDRIYLTRIHADYQGDVFYPAPDFSLWKEVSCQSFKKDENNPHDYTFYVYEKDPSM